MFENIAAAHRWAIDKGAAHIKGTPTKSRSQVYYILVRKIRCYIGSSTSSCLATNKKPPGSEGRQ